MLVNVQVTVGVAVGGVLVSVAVGGVPVMVGVPGVMDGAVVMARAGVAATGPMTLPPLVYRVGIGIGFVGRMRVVPPELPPLLLRPPLPLAAAGRRVAVRVGIFVLVGVRVFVGVFVRVGVVVGVRVNHVPLGVEV